jgi:NitT/TauT family transport system substrate-binding protein
VIPRRSLLLAAVTLAALAACKRQSSAPGAPLRLAFFPNVTHAQALVGSSEGAFAAALGGADRLVTRQFNAGPAAMEALLAGDVDVAYVGPGPAVIAYLRSQGGLRVVAGAASGGAVLIVKDAKTPRDLAGKRVGSPQLGNTQDIALRTWLRKEGVEIGEGPGRANVTPLSNADILQLFKRGDLAGAWVPEPWGARLIAEAGGKILVDERTLWPGGKFPITIMVASRRALEARRADVMTVVRAHLELTQRWKVNPGAFAQAANAEYGRLTGHPLPPAVVEDAFSRLEPTDDPTAAALVEQARQARALGFAPEGDLSEVVDATVLRDARGARRAAAP